MAGVLPFDVLVVDVVVPLVRDAGDGALDFAGHKDRKYSLPAGFDGSTKDCSEQLGRIQEQGESQ